MSDWELMMRHLTHWLRAGLKSSRIVFRVVPPKLVWLGLSGIALLPGCVYSSHRDAGMGLGGGLGALTGAMIGQESGHTLGGALIGAVAGGVVGGLIGEGEDRREQRDAAVTQAQYLASTGQVLTNMDILRMVHCGLSEEVIITTITNTVGKYDLSPDAIIQLKTFGTSDRIILTLQRVPAIPPISAAGYASSCPRSSVGLVVAPAPVVMYRRPRHYYYGGPNYHRRCW